MRKDLIFAFEERFNAIVEAITKVTGCKIEEITNRKSRCANDVDLTLFCVYFLEDCNPEILAKYLHKDRCTILYYRSKSIPSRLLEKPFRDVLLKIKSILDNATLTTN